MPRLTTLLFWLGAFSVPAIAFQLDGHFYLSKKTYSAGEPIYLIFEVDNKGADPIMIKTADPLSFCGGYEIEVPGVRGQEASGCYGGRAGSCTFSDTILHPGERHTDRILLNNAYDLRQSGRYSLDVTHELPYGPADGELSVLNQGTHETFDAKLEIVIESSSDSKLKPQFQKYVQNLQSTDVSVRTEAAQVIADLAPPFLEGTILQMLRSPELRYFAVRGLRNLGTASAHRDLADFLKNSPPDDSSGAYQDAIRYLGEIGDRSDLAVLLEVAHSNPPDSNSREVAMESAGRVGGDDAVPFLVAELQGPSIDVKQSAIRALYLTASRKAVPILIGLLRSPEERISGTAEFGLRVLTHRSVGERPGQATGDSSTDRVWLRWWTLHGKTAEIFRDDQCAEPEPLT